MTNLEKAPAEWVCDDGRPDGARTAVTVQVLTPREVPLGGIRAMTVRRTLPQRAQSFIGAWCFLDHYGPDDVARTGGMRVPPHPHTGLQTVSWLFAGEVEHRDSIGTHALVRPGEMNLMTAGVGISHSEDSTDTSDVLHGVQLWTLLPERHRQVAPAFDHHVPPVDELPGGGTVQVFLGHLGGRTSPVRTWSPLLGAEVRLPSGGSHTWELDPTFEHGVLVDAGAAEVEVDGVRARAARDELLHVSPGGRRLTLRAAGTEPLRVVLLGGEPLGEQVVMWWNFIGRDHDEVAQARAQWEAQLADDGAPARFGRVEGHPADPLPAPPMPHHRLKPRG